MSADNEKSNGAVHQALYRKWRPQTFDEVSGQSHITSVLKNEVASDRISHAYLFCGSRGTGKTSCAKIFSRAVNCLNPENGNPCGKCENCIATLNEATTDIVEMDAASNTGVDYIRDIRDAVVYAPSMLKYRVYIIDEVHMLSQSAFNALLKTLEEPPSNVIFILATTEVSKIPVTVISRCQRFDFKRLTIDEIKKRLLYIASEEGFELDEDGAYLIARFAFGGMRDAVSLLDLCSSVPGKIDADCVRKVSGASPREMLEELACAICDSDKRKIFEIIAHIYDSSLDISPFWLDLIRFWRDMLVCKVSPESLSSLDLLKDETDKLKEISARFTAGEIIYQSRLLDDAYNSIQRGNTDKRLIAEMTLIKMSEPSYSDSQPALLARIDRLEEELSLLKSGAVKISPDKEEKKKPESEQLTIREKSAPVSEVRTESKQESGALKVDNWIEVITRVEKANISAAAFMNNSSAVKRGGDFIIYLESPFSVTMIENDSEIKELIKRNVNIVYPESVDYKIKFEPAAQNKTNENSIDEILNGGTL